MLIKLKDIHKVYGSGESAVKALNGVNIEVYNGEIIAIMGKSGSGKSTLLNIIGGLDKFDHGEYYFNEKRINFKSQKKLAEFRRGKIGFIVQHFALIDDKTVFNNVALPLKYKLCTKDEIEKRVNNVLEEMGILDKAQKYPYELSGGQKQRVAIARAIINNPEVLLADEPTGALDESTETAIMNVFKSMHNKKRTIIIVTHDERIAAYCNRIIRISDGVVI